MRTYYTEDRKQTPRFLVPIPMRPQAPSKPRIQKILSLQTRDQKGNNVSYDPTSTRKVEKLYSFVSLAKAGIEVFDLGIIRPDFPAILPSLDYILYPALWQPVYASTSTIDILLGQAFAGYIHRALLIHYCLYKH